MSAVSHATSEPRGPGRWLLRFELHVPYAYEALWPVLTTGDGLWTWLAEARVLERRLGGAVTLHWPDSGATETGEITAWDTERVVEYTLSGQGRIRFHLEPVGTDSTVIRFLDERGGDDAERLDALAGWHDHFELLEAALSGHPAHWPSWTGTRRAELRAAYAA
ncbi:SRPBCC domain-containing protein [Streptomyces sp. NPDC059708]|uniref:SRPBCC domain-containing protein n=1 Tax=Streptomyces sp. NPDC059708 TaxID=3346916 RepID=UPI0036B3331A